MSTISDWAADYTTGDTNTPAANTAIPFPANTTTDLGQVLRDRKAVIRRESLNKGWEPDAQSVTYVNTTTFRISGDVSADWPVSMAVKCAVGNSTVYTWVRDVTGGANTDIRVTDTALANTLTTVTRSGFKPGSNPVRNTYGYPIGVGVGLPGRVSQQGKFRISETTNTVTVPFKYTEPDTNYQPLIQLVESDLLADLDASRFTTVTKGTNSMTLVPAAAPGAGNSLEFEYALVRGT